MNITSNILILAILIFFSRICDVSIGTVRIIFVSKSKKFLASLLGFFEVLIWIMAIKQIMGDMSNIWLYLAYAAGFSSGTFIGILIEEKLSLGKVIIRIITHDGANELIKELKSKKYILTISDAQGRNGRVKIIFSVIDRKKIKLISKIIKEFAPKAFYTVEDIKYAKEMNYIDNSISRNKVNFNRIGK